MLKSVFVAAALLTAATAAQAAPSRDDLLVTPLWLGAHINDKNLVILHVGSESGFAAGHIPGAHLVNSKILTVTRNGLSDEVPDADVLRDQMASLGISDGSHIVVYNEGEEFQRGTRVLFTMDVAGFGDHSSLLDGGLDEWKTTGHAAVTPPTPAGNGK